MFHKHSRVEKEMLNKVFDKEYPCKCRQINGQEMVCGLKAYMRTKCEVSMEHCVGCGREPETLDAVRRGEFLVINAFDVPFVMDRTPKKKVKK